MSRLDELVKDVEKMNTDELLDLVRQIRADRRISKQPLKANTRKTRQKASVDIKALLKSLSPEDRAKFLEKLTK